MSQTNHYVLSAAYPQEWARAEHLLPGFLKKTLSTSDQEWMEQWTNQIETADGLAAEALRKETAWVKSAQESLSQRATEFNAQAGWQKLTAELEAERRGKAAPRLESPVSVFQKFKQWLTKIAQMQHDRALQWWQKPAAGVLGSALIIGQMGFLAAAVKQLYVAHTDTTIVSPSSGASRPTEGALLKVAFKPDATVKDIMSVLTSIEGRVTGGPGALGIWEIEVPTDKLPAALKLLEGSKAVESVMRE